MPAATRPMKMPKGDPTTLARFEVLCPKGAGIVVRPMFGQASAFVAGQMFLGTFGDTIFVRLSESDRAAGLLLDGAHLFEPMQGRPMREYVVLPDRLLADPALARPWVDRALRYARSLPPKVPKRVARPKTR